MQPHFINCHNFAFCAMADRLQSPTARLGCRFVCTTSGFAQKKDTRPVGGRGISAFSDDFFLPSLIFNDCHPFNAATPSGYVALGTNAGIAWEVGGFTKNAQISFIPISRSAFHTVTTHLGRLRMATPILKATFFAPGEKKPATAGINECFIMCRAFLASVYF